MNVYFSGYGFWCDPSLYGCGEDGEFFYLTESYHAHGVFRLFVDNEKDYKFTKKFGRVERLLPCLTDPECEFSKCFIDDVGRGGADRYVFNIDLNKESLMATWETEPDGSINDDDDKKSRRNAQISIIKQVAIKLDYDPLNIPQGGKAAIKTECQKVDPTLFSPAAFDHAWKKANKRNEISMENKEKYTSKNIF